MRWSTAIVLVVVVGVLAAYVTWYVVPDTGPLPEIPGLSRIRIDRDEHARKQFYRECPGEKPLNWKIAAKAEELHRTKPMGKFVLHENDCSDFEEAIIDDALGAKARFRRDSSRHILSRQKRLWRIYYWDRATPLLPGDAISLRHSPHYRPYEGAIWHVGVIGTDGMVYDWSKLKSWSAGRYGRNTVERFARYSHGAKDIIIRRLKAEYRYRARPLPVPPG